MAGDVSANTDFYEVFQYGDILQDTADAIRRKQKRDGLEFNVSGDVEVADDYHKMRAEATFNGDTDFELAEDDTVSNGMLIRSGHSGSHGFKAGPYRVRQICENGMTTLVADHIFEQTHSTEYDPTILTKALDATIDGTDQLIDRIEEAESSYLKGGKDELRIMMHETIGDYLDTPVGDIPLSIEEETSGDDVNLHEAYQAMTRALSHHAKDNIPQYKLDDGFEAAAQLLETGYNELPDAERLGQQYVERRANQLIENQDSDRYFEGEDETVRELMAEHGLTA